ncbi:PAS domain-containing protein [Listeria sp. PSOL-1]|uniref:PAS domain-containing protein n=1 Tax=Listeria sp. PSOL-1 TaxID=1844999 RepID=UPI0013D4E0F4|nr:STAS domain-containing protein [Listeria sp. PSOL-1]
MKEYVIPIEAMSEALYLSPTSAIISDPQLPGNPFIFVNQAFENLTGYSKEEIIGQNGHILQGGDTYKEPLADIRKAIQSKRRITCTLKNYKKSGEPFYNELTIQPIYDEKGNFYYFGTQKDVTESILLKQKMEKYQQVIENLTAPIIPINHRITILPIIGDIDNERMNVLIKKSLQYFQAHDMDHLILDFTGLITYHKNIIDDIVAFYKTLNLLGIQSIITGLSPKLVQEWTNAKDSLEKVATYHSVNQALKALKAL